MFELKSRYLLFEGDCSHSEYNALPKEIPIGTVHTVRGDSLFSFDYWIEKKTYLKAFRSRKKMVGVSHEIQRSFNSLSNE